MSFVTAAPDIVTAAAADLAKIGSAVSAADSAALAKTTGVLPAAADEVSVQIAALFDSYASGYREITTQATAFHDQFVQLLNVGAGLYDSAEAASVSLLQGASGAVNAPAQALLGHPLIGTGIVASAANSLATALGAPTPAGASPIAFIMGGNLNAQPDPSYVAAINGTYIQPNPNFTGFNPFGLYTPEGANIPGISGVTLAQSVAEGQLILNNAIMGLPMGTQALVFGYSQSAAVVTLEMRALDALPPFERPSPSDLSFMLIGDIDNPNGGLFSRFTLNIPILDIPFYGATPSNTPYPITIYTGQ